MKKTTQKEIAEKNGVNVRTVSRVLNDPEAVKPATRQRVISELNDHGCFFQSHSVSGPDNDLPGKRSARYLAQKGD